MLSARFSVQQVLRGVLLLALTAAVATPLQAQISIKATPYSFRAHLVDDLPSYALSPERLQKPVPQVYQKRTQAWVYLVSHLPAIRVGCDGGSGRRNRKARRVQAPQSGHLRGW